MARAWIIDGRSIAKQVSGVSRSCAHQIEDCGATHECPNCNHLIDNSDVAQEWPGLPVGVKFDPSDLQLLEHLAAKCGVGNSKPHFFIDEFIPTLSDDKGICYTHPGKIPGSKKDGDCVHFFHRTVNAYATGQRKHRRIHSDLISNEESARWHETGKTKSVMENGVQKGCKKIMVLYNRSKKGSKPVKPNWVMHQYHLGTRDDEKEGEYVVSKIFYQQKQNIKNDNNPQAGSKRKRECDSEYMSKCTPRVHQFLNEFPELPPEKMELKQDLQKVSKMTEDLEKDAVNYSWLCCKL